MPKHSSREDKRPADLWFWDDWFASADVRLCSLAAQGLWISMLGYMARSEKKGALLINGKQISSKDLATLTGKSEAEIPPLLQELEDRGVYSKLLDGTIINRRMFRESELRRVRAEAGRLGGLSSKQNDSKDGSEYESKEESKPQATLEDGNEDEDLRSSKNKKIPEIIVAIIDHLNAKTGKKFRAKSEATVRLINGRLAEGRTLEDFRHVIDVKTAKWLGDPKMDDFLRPDTLFAASNFESYLNERLIQPRRGGADMVGYNAPPPVTKEQKAEQDRQIEAACDEVDKNYGPLIESARKAGDKAQIKKLADKARMKREDLIMEILYPEVKKFHAERDKQGEARP